VSTYNTSTLFWELTTVISPTNQFFMLIFAILGVLGIVGAAAMFLHIKEK